MFVFRTAGQHVLLFLLAVWQSWPMGTRQGIDETDEGKGD